MSTDVYEVVARNIATASENKIHDNEAARRLGFAGGLVVGVEVYAYMTHAMMSRFGKGWLDHGLAECRFLKPVYEGELVQVLARDEDGRLSVEATSKGELCAAGAASIASGSETAVPLYDAIPYLVPPLDRPVASAESLAPGTILCTAPAQFDEAALTAYLDAVSERDPVYLKEDLVHPGMILRLGNQALMQNVRLGPWIHVASSVRNFAAARLGEELTLRPASKRITKPRVMLMLSLVGSP